MKNFKIFILIALVLSSFSCIDEKAVDRSVKNKGALMQLMSGNLEATVSLDSLQTLPHLYALGALENLKGEIQIFDGQSFVSKKEAFNKVQIQPTFDHKASLLVYAQVPKWDDAIQLDEFTINSQLEKQIKNAAIVNGIDAEKPFPFLIKGRPSLLSWHVINWNDNDMEHSHKKHLESGPHGTFENKEVEIIGFYSEKHKAVFTHHTTFLHMHFKTDYKGIAGHVDSILGEKIFENQLELYLPKN